MMTIKRLPIISWILFLVLFQPGLDSARVVAAEKFQSNPRVEAKIAVLLARMTLEEKVGQLTQFSYETPDSVAGGRDYKALLRAGQIGSMLNVTGADLVNQLQTIAVEQSRLKIPVLFGYDVIHGYRTVFPIPLAEASSWDPALVEQTAHAAAREASAAGIRWTFAPMVDIARDPRWGRIAEGSGEDSYLGSVMAAARVRGFQGADLADPTSMAACPKHFAAYGAGEGGRDYNTVDISEQTLREIYLPPFRAAVDAGAATLMSGFPTVNGVPPTGSPLLLKQILRKEWGFQGFVVSDWNSVGELVVHGVAADSADATGKAMIAGTDMDMAGGSYMQALAGLVRAGKVPVAVVDEAVRRVLRVKFRLGLFDYPVTDTARESNELLSRENLALARKMAQESVVLLKNESRVLPLSKTLKTLAVIGPLADSREDMLGPWSARGRAEDVVSLLDGIRAKVGAGTRVIHSKGVEIPATVKTAREAEAVVLVVGEERGMSGEASSRAHLGLPGNQRELVEAVAATKVPFALVVMSGRPLAIPWEVEHSPAVLQAWFLGVQTGHALADILFGDVNPSGKLPVTVPRSVGQIPLYYNHLNTGRPTAPDRWKTGYLDESSEPLFPFGHGLSYTQFKYSNLRVSASRSVSVEVENTGSRAGDEIVQLYVRHLVAATARPVKELKGFQRVSLAAGEKKTVTLDLRMDPGKIRVWVGDLQTELE